MKIDELKRLAANGQYRKAGKVLDTVDMKKIKNVKELYIVVDILIENERYDEAKNILIGISKKLKSRRVYHQLVDVSIKAEKVDWAKKYMKEFAKLAPKDPYNYVFQYQLAQLQQESFEKQIEILEELKQYEYMEKWAYELAKVYYKAGRDADCVAECNDLILWFGEGVYVEKAKLLQQYLTEAAMPSKLKEVSEQIKNKEIRKVFTPVAEIRPDEEEKATQSIEKGTQLSSRNVIQDETLVSVKHQHAAKPVESQKNDVHHEYNHRPSYQTAFDFIEDMELREQEEELDRIIEAAKKKKEMQQESFEREERQESEEEPVSVEAETSMEEEKDMEVEMSVEEQQSVEIQEENPIGKTEEDVPTEESEEAMTAEQKEASYVMANEHEVKQLVDETADSLREQIGVLFSEAEITAEEPETELQVAETASDSAEVEQSEDELVYSENSKNIPEEPVEMPEIPEEVKESLDESASTKEESSENDADIQETAKDIQRQQQIQDVIDEVSLRNHHAEVLENKEAVLEDVDKLIRKRRQRATTKKLNEFVRERLGEEVEAKDYLGEFAKIHTVGEATLRSLESIAITHNNSTVIRICGQSTFCQTYFSRKLAKLLCALNLIETQKFLLLGYEKFCRVDFEAHIEQIQGGCVVIEEVPELTENMSKQIQLLIEHKCQVILEMQLPEVTSGDDIETEQAKRLHAMEQDLARIAKIETIWLESFDEEELLGFAQDFLEEKEYHLEPEAEQVFTEYLQQLTESGDADAFCKVLEKITKAYHCANERNKVELRNIAELGNYQDAAFMSIKDTDFANEN